MHIRKVNAYLDEHGRERRRVLIRATTYNERRVIQQLLKYGDKAELVSPPHLREQIQRIVQRMNSFYKYSSPMP
jgi:predicted DNA-binding transcriptional regulator YafY